VALRHSNIYLMGHYYDSPCLDLNPFKKSILVASLCFTCFSTHAWILDFNECSAERELRSPIKVDTSCKLFSCMSVFQTMFHMKYHYLISLPRLWYAFWISWIRFIRFRNRAGWVSQTEILYGGWNHGKNSCVTSSTLRFLKVDSLTLSQSTLRSSVTQSRSKIPNLNFKKKETPFLINF